MRLNLHGVLLSSASFLLLLVFGLACAPMAAPPASPTPRDARVATPTREARPPVAPTVAIEATRAPSPTPRPPDFPERDRAITLTIPAAPGSTLDLGARLAVPFFEQELGAAVQAVNRPEGGGEPAIAELARSKPDGYSLAVASLPRIVVDYLDPDRKAAYGRKNLQPVGALYTDPVVIAAKPDSPYKTLRDLVAAAKERPRSIKAVHPGTLSLGHLAILLTQKTTGAEFSVVPSEGKPWPALLGSADVAFLEASEVAQPFKGGLVRVLATLGGTNSRLFPNVNVQSAEGQGYKLKLASVATWCVPAGTPGLVAGSLSGALRRAAASEVLMKRVEETPLGLGFMDPEQANSYWGEMEIQVRSLMELAAQ